MKVIFLSNQLFDFPLKTNKWHVATRVAERGHEVLFVDPPIRLRKLVKQVWEGRWSLKRILTGLYCHSGAERSGAIESQGLYRPAEEKSQTLGTSSKSDSGESAGLQSDTNGTLYVFTPLTFSLSESPNLMEFNIRRMKQQFPKFFDREAVLWVYNPAMVEYIEKIPHRLLVYDCVDDYPSMANYIRLGISEEIARREREIATQADVVFATTRRLAQKLSKYNNNVHYVGNAGDYERFAPVGKARLSVILEQATGGSAAIESSARLDPGPPGSVVELVLSVAKDLLSQRLYPRLQRRVQSDRSLEAIPRSRIGFTGAIDEYKLNLPLLVEIARTYPDHSLVLVGPQGVADSQPDLSELKKLPNVHLIGQRPYEEMPEFFAEFDCYIIPYTLNDYTLKGCFPVKFFDALAAGLPTIVSNLPDYEPFYDVCYIAKSDEEFSKAIQIALLENSTEKIQARMRTARKNSWDKKVDKMLRNISEGV